MSVYPSSFTISKRHNADVPPRHLGGKFHGVMAAGPDLEVDQDLQQLQRRGSLPLAGSARGIWQPTIDNREEERAGWNAEC